MPLPLLLVAPMILSGGFAATGITTSVRAYQNNKDADLAEWKAQNLAKYSEEALEQDKQQCIDTLKEYDSLKKDVFINCIVSYINALSSIHNIEFDTTSLALNDSGQFHLDQKKLGELKKVEIMGGGTAVATALFGAIGTPALAIAGSIIAGKAKENKAKAEANLAQANVYYEETKTLRVFCTAIFTRVSIFQRLLIRLSMLLQRQMFALNDVIAAAGHDYNMYSDEQKKVIAMGLSTLTALKALMDEHLLDEEGQLTKKSSVIVKEIEQSFFDDSTYDTSENNSKQVESAYNFATMSSDNVPARKFENTEQDKDTPNDSSIILEDYVIYSDVEVPFGETLVIKNKRIYIRANINCYGTLKLRNCHFIYNQLSNTTSASTKHQILLKKGASLFISNCVFRREKAPQSDLSCLVYSNDASSTVVIDNSTFIDCNNFLDLQYCKKFLMQRCEIHNCADGFVSVRLEAGGNSLLQSCLIYMDNAALFKQGDGRGSHYLGTLFSFERWGNERPQIINCKFVETDEFRTAGEKVSSWTSIRYVMACADSCSVERCDFIGISGRVECSHIEDCTFIDCSGGIEAMNYLESSEKDGTEIKECVFKNCTNVVAVTVCTHLHHSQFIGCHGKFITTGGYQGKSTISDCEFINTRYDETDGGYLSCDKTCIALDSDEEDGHTNLIENCLFDGIDLTDATLIRYASPYCKHKNVVISVNNCEFRNLKSNGSSHLYVCTEVSSGFLGIKNYNYTVSVDNCKGTDIPTNGTGHAASYTEKTYDSETGAPLGADLSIVVIDGKTVPSGYIGVSNVMAAAALIEPVKVK